MNRKYLLIYFPLLVLMILTQSCKNDEQDIIYDPDNIFVTIDGCEMDYNINRSDHLIGTGKVDKDGGQIVMTVVEQSMIYPQLYVKFFTKGNDAPSIFEYSLKKDSENDYKWEETTYPYSSGVPYNWEWGNAIMKQHYGNKKLYINISPNTTGESRSILLEFEHFLYCGGAEWSVRINQNK